MEERYCSRQDLAPDQGNFMDLCIATCIVEYRAGDPDDPPQFKKMYLFLKLPVVSRFIFYVNVHYLKIHIFP
jgi:hypothetical protein